MGIWVCWYLMFKMLEILSYWPRRLPWRGFLANYKKLGRGPVSWYTNEYTMSRTKGYQRPREGYGEGTAPLSEGAYG